MPRVTITVPDKKAQPYRFALERKSVSLGRGSENDIVIDCTSASVRHAVMERVQGGYELRDLGSTNGTKLKGKPCDSIVLADGLEVALGDVAFDFTLTTDEKLALASEMPDGEPPIIKEEEEEPVPSPESSRSQRPLASTQQPGPAASFFMMLLFLLLATTALFIGVSVRHQKETGRSLLLDMQHGAPPQESTSGAEEALPADESSEPTAPPAAAAPTEAEPAPTPPPSPDTSN